MCIMYSKVQKAETLSLVDYLCDNFRHTNFLASTRLGMCVKLKTILCKKAILNIICDSYH